MQPFRKRENIKRDEKKHVLVASRESRITEKFTNCNERTSTNKHTTDCLLHKQVEHTID